MIKFSLQCENSHVFDGWFGKSSDFDEQRKRGLVSCPRCGSSAVEKALMAPSVKSGRGSGKPVLMTNDGQSERMRKIRELVATIRANSEDVGERFPEEARKIHYGESEPRGILGKADFEQARELIEEGIAVAPIPSLPEDTN